MSSPSASLCASIRPTTHSGSATKRKWVALPSLIHYAYDSRPTGASLISYGRSKRSSEFGRKPPPASQRVLTLFRHVLILYIFSSVPHTFAEAFMAGFDFHAFPLFTVDYIDFLLVGSVPRMSPGNSRNFLSIRHLFPSICTSAYFKTLSRRA
jgi:hypothetical protein